ncbi:LysR family transcriptional regulator [Cypionkella sp.]|jgi:DNA-binding transcriptional LysR family regulator|uniref:LysR family transcriptional regulator n=1 Tax=Cypionkella sp. TaxID=2811411 RepID=UPI002FDE69E4
MIRLEALRALVTVAENGNIKDAADRLHRTPSAVSMTLKQIEDRLGGPLFEADRKQTLSGLGQLVYDRSVVLLRDYDRAMEVIATYAGARSGKLRLAAVPSVAVNLIPLALQAFVKQRPGLEIELFDTDSTEVHHLVESGQVDLGFAGRPRDGATLTFSPLFTDPFRLVCRSDTKLATHKQPLAWPDLATQDIIQNEACRGLTSEGFRALAQKSSLSVRNVSSLLAMVQAGMGITLLPALATAALPLGLCALTLADASCFRTVGILTPGNKVQSPLAKAFHSFFSEDLRKRAQALSLKLI